MILLLATCLLQDSFDVDASRRRVQEIVKRYPADDATDRNVVEGFARWIKEFWNEFTQKLIRLRMDQPFLYWGILAVCLVLLGLIFLHGYVVVRRAVRPGPRGETAAGPAAAKTFEDYRRMAQDAEGAGRYSEALVFLFRALLLWLDARGKLRYKEETTNWEYYRAVSHQARLADPFRGMISIFERTIYGRLPLDQKDYRAARAQVSAIAGNEI
jgi:hypothetical protein